MKGEFCWGWGVVWRTVVGEPMIGAIIDSSCRDVGPFEGSQAQLGDASWTGQSK